MLTRINPLIIKRHILLVHNQPTHPLLPVAGRELVPELRAPRLADEHLDERLLVVRVADHDLVDVARDGRLVRQRRVAVRDGRGLPGEGVVRGVGRGLLVHVDVAWVDALADAGEAVELDDVVFLSYFAVFV
jgi:hypothetical protein